MAAAATVRNAGPAAGRRSFWTGTSEIYFSKAIDNSRLVKVEDAQRGRERMQFCTALVFFFLLVFGYTWQHFRAIEYAMALETQSLPPVSLLPPPSSPWAWRACTAIPSAR